MLDEKEHPELASVDIKKHVPNQIAMLMLQRINLLYKQGKITGDQLIILEWRTRLLLLIYAGPAKESRIRLSPIHIALLLKNLFLFML